MANPTTLYRNSTHLVRLLLEEPELEALVRNLPAADWKSLVGRVGLEDASELLALSSTEQLVELIDDTLWNDANSDEFDEERFATLLEVLHESGAELLASKVASLPEEFLLMALARLLSVWPSEFLRQLSEDDESGVLDKRLESQMFEEFGEFTLLSPTGLAWDALIALLDAWGDSQPQLLQRILERLSAVNVRGIAEPDELVNVLDEMAELEEDAQAEREERRARSGYVSVNDARAFLKLPKARPDERRDAISAAYFRRLKPQEPSKRDASPRLVELLRRSETLQAQARRKLSDGSNVLKAALDALAMRSPERHRQCLEELAFLTNVVATSLGSERGQSAEGCASEGMREVVRTLEVGCSDGPSQSAEDVSRLSKELERLGPVALFRNRPR